MFCNVKHRRRSLLLKLLFLGFNGNILTAKKFEPFARSLLMKMKYLTLSLLSSLMIMRAECMEEKKTTVPATKSIAQMRLEKAERDKEKKLAAQKLSSTEPERKKESLQTDFGFGSNVSSESKEKFYKTPVFSSFDLEEEEKAKGKGKGSSYTPTSFFGNGDDEETYPVFGSGWNAPLAKEKELHQEIESLHQQLSVLKPIQQFIDAQVYKQTAEELAKAEELYTEKLEAEKARFLDSLKQQEVKVEELHRQLGEEKKNHSEIAAQAQKVIDEKKVMEKTLATKESDILRLTQEKEQVELERDGILGQVEGELHKAAIVKTTQYLLGVVLPIYEQQLVVTKQHIDKTQSLADFLASKPSVDVGDQKISLELPASFFTDKEEGDKVMEALKNINLEGKEIPKV